MAQCPMVHHVSGKALARGEKGYLYCLLEEGHDGAHVDVDGAEFKVGFIPYGAPHLYFGSEATTEFDTGS